MAMTARDRLAELLGGGTTRTAVTQGTIPAGAIRLTVDGLDHPVPLPITRTPGKAAR